VSINYVQDYNKPVEISMAMLGNRIGDIGKQLQHSRESVTPVSKCIETLLVKEM
jgi:hypothetical protein